jgi:hypothetical protein
MRSIFNRIRLQIFESMVYDPADSGADFLESCRKGSKIMYGTQNAVDYMRRADLKHRLREH